MSLTQTNNRNGPAPYVTFVTFVNLVIFMTSSAGRSSRTTWLRSRRSGPR
ncbi:hypothetical protein BSU04_09200 [Caballeronia sordidicola]|uniref:Uncharacterized protein n=1 Tax=Caballeronia sordidicola TaxID=196367 RepID=A0A226X6M0_CABSO|nr:hypothetical protein BSU04_09200 [Caballeronia sordidicola]